MGLSSIGSGNDASGGFSLSGSSGIDDGSEVDLDSGVLNLLKSSDFSYLLDSAQQKLDDKIVIQKAGGSAATATNALDPSQYPQLSSLVQSADIPKISESLYALIQDPTRSAKFNITPAQKEAVTQVYSGITPQLKSLRSTVDSLNASIDGMAQSQAISIRQRDAILQKISELNQRAKQIHLGGILAISEALTTDQFLGVLQDVKNNIAAPSAEISPQTVSDILPNSELETGDNA